MKLLRRFGEDLWIADGPMVRFFGMPYPTRMVVIRLSDGSLWIYSPVAATSEQAAHIEKIGPVAHLVSPTPLHDWRLTVWAQFFPRARVWKASMLGDAPPPAWETDIKQISFRGSVVLSEMEFFHRRSRTLIMGDFIQNFQPAPGRMLRTVLLRLGGIFRGGMPRDLRFSFFGNRRRRMGQESLRGILSWDFDKLIVAHGDCVETDAKAFVERSFRWLRSS
jgi:hypothetical protein